MTEKKFRSSMSGFNRKDVVLYIEQINNEHNNALNQLRNENQILRGQLESQNTEALSARVEELEKALEQTRAALAEEQGKREEALQKITELEESAETVAREAAEKAKAEQELEAYRRAEQAERAAKERVEQLYRQATGTLAEATTHVDTAAEQFGRIADQLNGQMDELQAAIVNSKNALMDAATVMYTIHLPEQQ